jgi:AcrR family transcriptional regulator
MSESGVQSARATSSPHVERKRRRRRDEILHSALRAFREHGYHGTTLEQIAGRLGLRKSALYHYFADKEAILYECHLRSLRELEQAVEDALADFESAEDRLGHIVRAHVRVMTETLQGSSLAFEVSALSPTHRSEVVEARDRYERRVRDVIMDGVRSGEFRTIDPKIGAFGILGAINWIAHWYDPDGSLPAPELAARFVDHLVGGLTHQPSHPMGA